MPQPTLREDRGFTVAELMVVVLILGILVVVAVSSYVLATERALRIACLSNQRAYDAAVQQWAAAHNTAYPDTLRILNDQGFIRSQHPATCPRDPSVRYLYDPDTGTLSCPTHPLSP